MNCLRKREGEIVDLSMWFSFFAFDFMGDLAYGFFLFLKLRYSPTFLKNFLVLARGSD